MDSIWLWLIIVVCAPLLVMNALGAFDPLIPLGNWLARKFGLQGPGEPGAEYVGRSAQIAVPFVGAKNEPFKGKVSFDGTLWNAEASDPSISRLIAGDFVEVEKLEGLVLHVRMKS